MASMAALAISGGRRYYGAMDSGLFTKVITSAEVIAASLFLILLLPLVFFIASTRSRRRFTRTPRARPARRRAPAPQLSALDEEVRPPSRRRAAAAEPEEEEGQQEDERR